MIRRSVMRSRAQGVLVFAAILATCVAGILQLSWWAFVAGACGLALISMSNHALTYRTLGTTEGATGLLVFSSLLNASVTAAAALIVGRGIGWFWGV